MSYRTRLEQDLHRWVASGLVPAESREAILASVGEERRLDAATTLGVVAAFLGGVAIIAFVAANWSEIPRIGRFMLILAAFLVAAGAAAWAAARGRPVLKNTLLSVAALIFAAAIGLTGQIFDIAGQPDASLRAAGVAAAVLALAGASPWPAAIALVLFGLGDIADQPGYAGRNWLPWIAPVGLVWALVWRSTPLAHVSGLALPVAALLLPPAEPGQTSERMLVYAVGFAAFAAAARWLRGRAETEGVGAVLYGWFTAAALAFLGAGVVIFGREALLHSLVWIAGSVAILALGRHDRHSLVSAAGLTSLLAAGATLLFNLGVGLMTSAGIFGASAVAALAVAAALRGKRRA